VRAAIWRAVGGAAVALAVWSLFQAAHVVWLCEPHRVWKADQAGKASVVVARSERQRRHGDALFVCEAPHRVGPVVLHQDLDCYCAPREMSAAAVAARLGGVCVADEAGENGGRCGGRYCNGFVDP
jgi:hypothetical protein